MTLSFQLIPVIDLKGGRVVHARRGARDAYRPLVSPLAPTSAPLDVVAGLMGLAPFRTLYVADLDAIGRAGDNAAALTALRAAFPALALWVDAGEGTPDAVLARTAAGLGTSVVGSESLADPVAAQAALAAGPVVLSLDHDAAGPRDPAGIHRLPDAWPARVIAMTLAKVGSGEGPDLATIAAVQARRPAGAVFAAGGVRGPQDLAALAERGVAGALVATALHDGRIDRATASAFA